MEPEGHRIFINVKNELNKNDKSFIPLLKEQDIGHEYPEKIFKFVDNNSFDLNEKDYFEKLECSFIDYNFIDDIKDDIFKIDKKYDISFYNNLSQSQLFYSDPKKLGTFTIPVFTYNPFFIEGAKKDANINVIKILDKLGIKFVDGPIFDRLNDCRATFAKNNSHFPYLKLSNLSYYLEMKKNSIHGIYPGLTISKFKKTIITLNQLMK